MGCLRHPKTTQERRESQYRGYCYLGRAKRNARNLPQAYDDIAKGTPKSWKKYRRTQYRPVPSPAGTDPDEP